MDIERRTFQTDRLELRPEGDELAGKLVGHAAVFNKPTEIAGFREVVAPGAFRNHAERSVVATVNHDMSKILGRTTAGTLELREDETGLLAIIDPPNTSYANDARESVQRGDIAGMSFSFKAIEEKWEHGRGEELDTRTLKLVELREVTLATMPAYEETDVAQRHHAEVRDRWTAERLEQDATTKREQARREREMQLADV